MPSHAPAETLTALGGGLLPDCYSRSLFQDRFADPQAKEVARKQWFNAFIAKSACRHVPTLGWLPEYAEVLHARLMSRLMVNLAGGVMENANLCLDRYGLPLIPGTAVKGCARRMALQALHDWNGAPASAGDSADDDLTAPCRVGDSPAAMLAAIARIFGWTPEDWKTTRNKEGHFNSDFAWAVHGDEARLKDAKRRAGLAESFAGTIALLPATPNHDPKLELDVVTPHHTAYYEDKAGFENAPDTEDPIPVFFPAVKPQPDGDYFTFPLIPLRLAQPGDLAIAKIWLAHGLEIFGLGAKTNAGYGWFDASDDYNQSIRERVQQTAERAHLEATRLADEAKRKAAEDERLEKKRQLDQALEGLSPEQREDRKVEMLTEDQFKGRIRLFCKPKGGPTDAEKAALVRALKGHRLAFWLEFKKSAIKGELATIDQAIRALNKQLHGDKMP